MLCLSTQFNRSLWLLPFLLFFCFIDNATADTCPAGWPTTTPQQSFSNALFTTRQPTEEILCNLVGDYYNTTVTPNGSNRCVGTGVNIGTNVWSSCAENYTFDGTQCVANCTPEEPCPEANSFFGGGSTTGDSLTGCNGSCELQSGGSCIATTDPIQGTTTSTFCGGWRFSGNSCETNNFTSGSSPDGVPSNNGGRPTKPSDCPPQTGYAEVNGEASCLPSGSTVDGGTATSTDPTTGNTTKTEIKTTINPDGTRSTTTTTSIFDSGGALISTSTGTSTNSGIGDGQGKEPQKIDLDFGESPTFDSTLPEEPQIQIKTQAGQTITTEVFSVAASCPADIVFEALGQEFTISFVPICDLADIIRGIILMLASIASIRIVVSS